MNSKLLGPKIVLMKTIFKLMHWFKRYDKVQIRVGKEVTFARGSVSSGSVTMGQTVEKLSVQPGKTARGFSTVSLTLLTP